MTLGIVILNYNTADLTVDCLRSVLEDASQISARIVIVDNGSTDGSPQKLAAEIAGTPCVELLPLPRNGGFACGNNRGIERLGDADYLLLLNSDCIVHRGCLATCLKIMEADKGIGVMSCLVKNADGSPQNVARKFPTPIRAILTTFG
ncbi:MAG TPA: glycosyltransferase, partial [Tepidisphaeraceae bacterium]|nr:glycosyltransferase [Tepidisphaeraceae bacterium]